jgi:uncharacterized protein (DUF1015 family)
MVTIKPFRGWIYDEKKVGQISKVAAPPHDVISDDEYAELMTRSEHNIAKILLPPNDDYNGAAKSLKELAANGIIKQDAKPCYYAYEQEFKRRVKTERRLGFVALIKATPLGEEVLPHELTFPDRVADRYNLLSAANAELCPVFGLFSGDGKIKKILEKGREDPLFEFTDDKGVVNRIWRVEDAGEITKAFKDKKVIIADGHHRYTAAAQYAKSGKGGFTMIYLADIEDPAVKILPTHRLIKRPRFDIYDFLKRASEMFDVAEVGSIDELESELEKHGKHSFGVHTKKTSHILKLKNPHTINALISEGSSEKKRLDVSVLHGIILKQFVTLGDGPISYSKHQDDVIRLINDGSHDVAFLLPHMHVREVVTISENGEVMPHKSTYFYPKPMAGVVMHLLDEV